MASLSRHKYYWIQTGGRWTEDTDLGAVAWTDEDLDLAAPIAPESVTKQSGPDPSYMTLLVQASASDVDTSGTIFPPTPVKAATDRAPDGTQREFVFPAKKTGDYALVPFTLVRLREADTNASTDKSSGVTRFVGIVTDYEYDLSAETCRVTVSEIARWHMGRIGLYGAYAFKVNAGSTVWIDDYLPVFNADGHADQYLDSDDARHGAFINHDRNSLDGVAIDGTKPYAGYWRLSDIWDYLRECYALVGSPGAVHTDKYLIWEIANQPTWPGLPWLAADSAGNANMARNFAMGGLSLAEAIDQVVTKAGGYDWHCEWDDTEHKYRLCAWSAQTGNGDSQDYTRGQPGNEMGESTVPEVTSGTLRVSVDDARTQVKALGARKRFEISVNTTDGHIEPGWTSAIQTTYNAASDADKASTKYQSVYQRFVIKDTIDWSAFFGSAYYFEGRRPWLPHLLSKVSAVDDSGVAAQARLRVTAWRYKSAAWEQMPDGVSVQLHKDGSIQFRGKAEGDDTRWLEQPASAGLYPVKITLAIEADERLSTTTDPLTDIPSGWPTLEKVIDNAAHQYEKRTAATLPTDGGAVCMDDPDGVTAFNNVLKTDQAKLDAEAQRTLDALARPRMDGDINLHTLDWDAEPGMFVQTLIGGGTRPDIDVLAVAHEITYSGLATGSPAMKLTLGGDTQ